MPTLKMMLGNNIISTLEISFKGLLTKEERQDHTDGLAAWMRQRNNNDVEVVLNPVLFIDRVESKANKIIRQSNFGVIEYKSRHHENKPILKFERPKAYYSNKIYVV